MLCTIAETHEYSQRVLRLLSNDEADEIIDFLSINPLAGVLLQGTGGLIKLRWSRNNKGKSTGVRVIYYFHNEHVPLYLLTIFSKNEKVNLSKRERNELTILVKLIKKQLTGNNYERGI